MIGIFYFACTLLAAYGMAYIKIDTNPDFTLVHSPFSNFNVPICPQSRHTKRKATQALQSAAVVPAIARCERVYETKKLVARFAPKGKYLHIYTVQYIL